MTIYGLYLLCGCICNLIFWVQFRDEMRRSPALTLLTFLFGPAVLQFMILKAILNFYWRVKAKLAIRSANRLIEKYGSQL